MTRHHEQHNNKITNKETNMKHKTLIPILLVALAACTTNTEEVGDYEGSDVAWTCTTTASCQGVTQTLTHDLCLRPSDEDIEQAGDSAAGDFEKLWHAACDADQGLLDDEGHVCLGMNGAPANWGCSVECEAANRRCTP